MASPRGWGAGHVGAQPVGEPDRGRCSTSRTPRSPTLFDKTAHVLEPAVFMLARCVRLELGRAFGIDRRSFWVCWWLEEREGGKKRKAKVLPFLSDALNLTDGGFDLNFRMKRRIVLAYRLDNTNKPYPEESGGHLDWRTLNSALRVF